MLLAKDYVRAAAYLMKRYGSKARERAEERAAGLRAIGETDVQAIWDVLVATLGELENGRATRRDPN